MKPLLLARWILVLAIGMLVSGEVYGQGALEERAEVVIEKVEVKVSPQGPVVLLEVGEQAIPIYVDPTVAGSIQSVLSGLMLPRPLSHDLMHTILDAYSVKVDRVFISLKDGIYYGTMTVSLNGQTKIFDSRSSDAIALAIHFHTPIIVSQNLLESAGQRLAGHDKNQVEL